MGIALLEGKKQSVSSMGSLSKRLMKIHESTAQRTSTMLKKEGSMQNRNAGWRCCAQTVSSLAVEQASPTAKIPGKNEDEDEDENAEADGADEEAAAASGTLD